MRTDPQRLKPLIDDAYTADPLRRYLDYLLSRRNQGARVIGLYCGYAPLELIRAAGAVPISLCASSQKSVAAAEAILPANLCPMIKSGFGHIRMNTCLLYESSHAVIGETTCDGKKKMFELISHLKPTHVMDLPQLPDDDRVMDRWVKEIWRLKAFLEQTLQTAISPKRVEGELQETNKKNRLMTRFFDYATRHPTPLSWSEMYDVIGLERIMTSQELDCLLADVFTVLNERIASGIFFGTRTSPRVLVSGCPVSGDAVKVLKIIEEAGGIVVAMESCSGMKGYNILIEEQTDDPLRAVAEATLKIPCSCMTPNRGRLALMDELIRKFKPDAVIDVVLHACHAYNVESYKIGQYVKERHGLPCLKIETDYSDGDVEQIRTRVEALFDSL